MSNPINIIMFGSLFGMCVHPRLGFILMFAMAFGVRAIEMWRTL